MGTRRLCVTVASASTNNNPRIVRGTYRVGYADPPRLAPVAVAVACLLHTVRALCATAVPHLSLGPLAQEREEEEATRQNGD